MVPVAVPPTEVVKLYVSAVVPDVGETARFAVREIAPTVRLLVADALRPPRAT